MSTQQLAVASVLPRSSATSSPAEVSRAPEQGQPTLDASQKRALHPLFVPTWSVEALLPRLPLKFPIVPGDGDLPPSPKTRYRCQYRYLGPESLLDPTRRAALTDFQIALYLIDFSPLEPVLARIYVQSLKGQVPFHPVSMFLAICLRREKALPWADLARLLAGDDGANWRRLLGFGVECKGSGIGSGKESNQTPSASGLRYFFDALGSEVFDGLCARFVTLLRQHGLFPEHSTYPGDPPTRGISLTQDGMLHPARSRPSCELAEDTCYQPIGAPSEVSNQSPTNELPTNELPTNELPTNEVGRPGSGSVADCASTPEATPANRPCRARERGLEGCACDTASCREQCRRASLLDPEARLIHYAGHNHKHGDQAQAEPRAKPEEADRRQSRGTSVFGYRSIVDRAIDDRFRVAWNLQTDLYPANADERAVFDQRLVGLKARYPDLRIGEWLDDSGVGYGHCLEAIWKLGALRMVDIRADPADRDPEACLRRGFDGQGRPLCLHGHPLRSNGHDYEHRRTKWVCDQVCRRKSRHPGEAIRPVEGCPYLSQDKPLGYVVNVGKTLPDGSLRLAREIPYGSEAWKARYGRRNLSESRNGQIEGMGLKRLRSFGLARNAKEVQIADLLMNLRTLGRLVREATNLQVN